MSRPFAFGHWSNRSPAHAGYALLDGPIRVSNSSTPPLRAKRRNPGCIRGGSLDCFVVALLAMTTRDSAFPRHNVPEFCIMRVPPDREGAGNAGCWPHPRALRAKRNALSRTQATSGQPGQPALPAQWCYGLLRALPGEPGLIASVACPRSSAGLIPASGDQDHAPLPSASASLVS